MKLKGLLLIMLALFMAIMPGVVILAEESSLSPYVKIISDPVVPYVKETIGGGLSYSQRNLRTLYRGDVEDQKWQEQTVSTIDFGDATAVKVVSWQKTGRSEWGPSSLRDSIMDFETKNPGYKVIAGVNGDFWDAAGGTHQPANNFVSNGDVLKKDNSKDPQKGVIGFLDGKEYVFGRPKASENMYLKIYANQDYNNEVIQDELPIASINSLSETGISLFYPNSSRDLNVTGYRVFKGEYINYKVSNNIYVTDNPVLGSFIKGQITEVSDSMTIIPEIPEGTFYLLAKYEELNNYLTVGSTLKCEYNLLGKFANVPDTVGYNYRILTDGVPQFQGKAYASNTFVSVNNPRTMVGFKADGTPVFIVVDGRSTEGQMKTGITLFEGGELLRINDCVQGFNLDGGGSTTMIVRDQNDVLRVINTPSDGYERRVGNSLLFVIRDPHIEVTNVTDSSITVEQTAPIVSGDITNIKIKLDGQEMLMEGSKLFINDLTKGTSYNLSYSYDIKVHGKDLKGFSRKYSITTDAFMTPLISEFKVRSTENNLITFDYRIKDDDNQVTQAYIEYGTNRFTINVDKSSTSIGDLPYGEALSFKLVLEYGDSKLVESTPIVQSLTAPKKGCKSGSVMPLLVVSLMAPLVYVGLRRKN